MLRNSDMYIKKTSNHKGNVTKYIMKVFATDNSSVKNWHIGFSHFPSVFNYRVNEKRCHVYKSLLLLKLKFPNLGIF